MGKEAKFIVRLLGGERKQLNDLVAQGRVAKTTRQRAMILLRVDQGEAGPGWHDERITTLDAEKNWLAPGLRPYARTAKAIRTPPLRPREACEGPHGPLNQQPYTTRFLVQRLGSTSAVA
jgi:hypothetical protein